MKRTLNISKKLRTFLEEKMLLEKFRDNAYNPECNGGKNSKNTDISNAFLWAKTPEKHDFWKKLDKEFDSILYES
jgi:hypothetical protein